MMGGKWIFVAEQKSAKNTVGFLVLVDYFR